MMSAARLLYAYLTEARYECIRTLRTPGFVIPFLVLPAALYLLFGVVLFGEAMRHDPSGGSFLFLGFCVFGVMGPGMFGFGIIVASDREYGLLTFRRALPMSPAAYLIAKMVMAVLFAAVVMLTMVLSAATLGHLRFSAGQFAGVAGIDVAGSLPFCALGLFLGTLSSAKSAPAYVNLAYLPMIYLSGLLIPLPQSIQWIALLSPAFYLNQLALHAAGRPAHATSIVCVAVLTGVTVLLTLFAVRRLARSS